MLEKGGELGRKDSALMSGQGLVSCLKEFRFGPRVLKSHEEVLSRRVTRLD